MFVSVVNYKTPSDTIECVHSVQRAYPDARIVVTTNSREDAPRIQRDCPDVKVIPSDNIGFGAAHNLAIAQAEPPIAILNPDVRIERDTLQVLERFLDEQPQARIVGPRLYGVDGDSQISCWRFPTLISVCVRRTPLRHLFPHILRWYQLHERDLGCAQRVPWVSGACMLLRERHYFDPNYFLYVEDADLCKRVGQVYYVPQARAMHKAQHRSHKSPYLALIHIKSLCYFRLKYLLAKYLKIHIGVW